MMSLRAVAVAGLCALLCAPAASKPRKKRGPLAAYIDPSAPDDPPRPPRKTPKPLSIVLLVDRSTTPTPWNAHDALGSLYRAFIEGDVAALLAFDASTDILVKLVPVSVGGFQRALIEMVPGDTAHDVASALDVARNSLATAPSRKVIVLVTDEASLDDKLIATTAVLRDDHIDVIVATRGSHDADALAFIAKATNGTVVNLASSKVPTELELAIRTRR